jgi:hypothetical protein
LMKVLLEFGLSGHAAKYCWRGWFRDGSDGAILLLRSLLRVGYVERSESVVVWRHLFGRSLLPGKPSISPRWCGGRLNGAEGASSSMPSSSIPTGGSKKQAGSGSMPTGNSMTLEGSSSMPTRGSKKQAGCRSSMPTGSRLVAWSSRWSSGRDFGNRQGEYKAMWMSDNVLP